MSGSRTMSLVPQILLSIAIIAISSTPAAANCNGKGDANGSPGDHNKYCVGNSQVGKSYWLRQNGPDPKHVRQLVKSEYLATEGVVQLENIQLGSNCAGTVKSTPFANDDILRIVPAKGGLSLQIFQPVPKAIFADDKLKPRFATPAGLVVGPDGGQFYLKASHTFGSGTSAETVDYFVMLADDNDGCTIAACSSPDNAPIEKYYIVEAFPSVDANKHPLCDAERPDYVNASGSLPFTPWTSVPASKPEVKRVQQRTSGGGGSNFP